MGHGADVIGYAFDGAIYCLEHAPEGARSEEGSAIFQCDEGGLEAVCDTCRHSLGCVEGYVMDDCPACTCQRREAQRAERATRTPEVKRMRSALAASIRYDRRVERRKARTGDDALADLEQLYTVRNRLESACWDVLNARRNG